MAVLDGSEGGVTTIAGLFGLSDMTADVEPHKLFGRIYWCYEENLGMDAWVQKCYTWRCDWIFEQSWGFESATTRA